MPFVKIISFKFPFFSDNGTLVDNIALILVIFKYVTSYLQHDHFHNYLLTSLRNGIDEGA